MQTITTKKALDEFVSNCKSENKTIGFVPTMGALHNGHLTLVRRAVAENDICIVSVFVNPTQFNDKNDLANYPRTLEADAALLTEAGCACVFAPTPDEMYNADEMTNRFEFDFGGLDQVMEGKFRPGHLAIIRRMTKLMNFPIEIVGCPIVREESGLALSSRNALLTPEQRQTAVHISAVLQESTQFALETSVGELHDAVVAAINAKEGLETEYFDIVNGNTLQSIERWDDAEYVVGCVTVYCGKIRLIDNIRYK